MGSHLPGLTIIERDSKGFKKLVAGADQKNAGSLTLRRHHVSVNFSVILVVIDLFPGAGDDRVDPTDPAAGAHQTQAGGTEGELSPQTGRGQTGGFAILKNKARVDRLVFS